MVLDESVDAAVLLIRIAARVKAAAAESEGSSELANAAFSASERRML